MTDGIVIAGGGLAGQRAAETLRREGYAGGLRMVCAEPHPPYDRPPLSKELLSAGRCPDSLRFRADSWYAENVVDLLLGVRAAVLWPDEQVLHLSDGSTLRYDRLLIATGARPRVLPALVGYRNVSTLRTVDDALWLREVLASGARLAIIGAGFVGLEVAASARGLGAEVTVIEAAPAPLSGVLGPPGRWFTDLHRSHGVEVITSTTVTAVHGSDRVRALRVATGHEVRADHVLVGAGVSPDLEWLAGSGLPTTGVPVDADGRSSVEAVFAAGDAALAFDPRLDCHVPGSHWERAAGQGARAARAMLGLDPGEPPLDSFWTDQYGIRINYLGDAPAANAYTVEGDAESRDFKVTYTREGCPVAVLLVGRPRELPQARKLITTGGSLELLARN
jgi:NADPH-dependent 2,4-dienoyl-CoA reductase/sulfur reductase-like enzyme